MGDSEYSFSLTTFSRTGKLLPLEYALNAVANGRTVIGICCKNGVVLVTDKTVPSTLCDSSQVYKIESITSTTGVCFAGLGPDYRVLGKCQWVNSKFCSSRFLPFCRFVWWKNRI